MDTRMSLSIIIVHYETPDLLEGCLRSIREHGGAGVREVLVVDNSRRLKAREVVDAFPGVRLLENTENTGFSRAVNQGIRDTSGEWFLILNPDTCLKPGALDALMEFGARHPDAGILGPRLVNPDDTLQYSCRRFYTFRTLLYRRTFLGRWMKNNREVREHLMLDYDHLVARVVDWVLGGAMLVRRRAAEDVGGMDERFFLYFEDVDWCYRMAKRGWKVWYAPAATVEHDHRRESARDLKGLSRHIMSSLRFWEKWSLVLYIAKQAREGLRGAATVLVDLLAVNLAFMLAFLLRGQLAFTLTKPLFQLEYYSSFVLLINVVVVGTLFARGLYRSRPADWAQHLVELGKGLAWASLIVMAATYAAYVKSYSRALILLFYPLSVVTLFAGRMWVDRGLLRIRERLGTRRRALLAGVEPQLGQAARLLEEADPSCEWCGRVDLERMGEGLGPEQRAERLSAVVRDERIQGVVMAHPASRAGEFARVAEGCRSLGVDLYFFSEVTPWLREGDQVGALGGVRIIRSAPFLPVSRSPVLRRFLEILLALALLPLALLGLVAAWLALLVAGRGPRWEKEVWDNGRAEPVPVWSLRARSGGDRLERAGITRGLLVFWILSGRLRLVGAPPRRFHQDHAAAGEGLEPLLAGITGEWFSDPARVALPADLERSVRQSDLDSDLRILVRSAARFLRLLAGGERPAAPRGVNS